MARTRGNRLAALSLASLVLVVSACGEAAGDSGSAPPASSPPPSSAASGLKAGSPDDAGDTIQLELGGVPYTFPFTNARTKSFVTAARTSEGVFWSPDPVMDIQESELETMPLEPFRIYRGDASNRSVTKENSELLLTLPLREGEETVFMGLMYGAWDGHLFFSTYEKESGMNQAKEWQLYDLQIDKGTAKLITRFHYTGGYLFYIGVQPDRKELVFVQSWPNADGDYDSEAGLYHWDTGKQEKPDSFRLGGKGIEYTAGGTLQSVDELG